jgi:spore coat polysaccharide biosynthesis predicted glycosyltransferase SpsG
LQNVQELAAQMPWQTDVVINVNDMAQRMADSDLAIGAAGSTSWERCCLGLPTLMVVLADNQSGIAFGLERAGAAISLDINKGDQFAETLIDAIDHVGNNETSLFSLSQAAAMVTNGCGTNMVAGQMLGKCAQ